MSNRNIAIGTAIILFSTITITLISETYLALQGINPLAAIAALTVAIIGVAWFKKTANAKTNQKKG